MTKVNTTATTEAPFITSEACGPLALACDQLRIDGLALFIERTAAGWKVTFLLPDGEVLCSAIADTVPNALWALVTHG